MKGWRGIYGVSYSRWFKDVPYRYWYLFLSGVYGQKEVSQIKKVINHAYDLGVNFFDTAEAYGNAEKILGETIKNYRDKVIISTKVGIRKNTKPNLSYDYINSACEDSLKRLNTEYIDIYNLHYI